MWSLLSLPPKEWSPVTYYLVQGLLTSLIVVFAIAIAALTLTTAPTAGARSLLPIITPRVPSVIIGNSGDDLAPTRVLTDESALKAVYAKLKAEFQIAYADADEDAFRFSLFKYHHAVVAENNADPEADFLMRLTLYSTLTEQEAAGLFLKAPTDADAEASGPATRWKPEFAKPKVRTTSVTIGTRGSPPIDSAHAIPLGGSSPQWIPGLLPPAIDAAVAAAPTSRSRRLIKTSTPDVAATAKTASNAAKGSRLLTDPALNWAPDTAFEFSWKHKLGAVQQQMLCGSCFAYGAIGMLEALYNIYMTPDSDKSIDLSVQQVLDCIGPLKLMSEIKPWSGCTLINDGDGHQTQYVAAWLAATGKFYRRSDYPTLKQVVGNNKNKQCKSPAGATPVTFGKNQLGAIEIRGEARKSGFDTTEQRLMNVLLNHPVMVSVHVTTKWLFYRSGVIGDGLKFSCKSGPKKNHNGDPTNHLVLLVGYGTLIEKKKGKNVPVHYWLLRNSWVRVLVTCAQHMTVVLY